MTASTIACIRGCTTKDHASDCPGEDCKGCMPRPADAPHVVCWADYTRTAQAITQAPDLVAHLLGILEPGAAREHGGEKHTKGAAAPAPMNLDAAADADALHAELGSWALLIMEEHPGRLNGPDWTGSDIRPATKRLTDWGERVYEDARLVGVRDPGATTRLASWLGVHLSWAMQQQWAGEMVVQVTRAVNITKGRWQTEDRPTFLPARCPDCGLKSLRRHAPRGYMLPETIDCANQTCMYVHIGDLVKESA
jgi:hypothetical protein